MSFVMCDVDRRDVELLVNEKGSPDVSGSGKREGKWAVG